MRLGTLTVARVGLGAWQQELKRVTVAGLRFGTRGRGLASVGTGVRSCTGCLPLALFRTMHDPVGDTGAGLGPGLRVDSSMN